MPPDGPAKPNHGLKAATHGMRRTGWFGAFLGLALLAVCAIGIYYLSADARREINALATANADSTQWALAQSEVELLALLAAARQTELPEVEHAAAVRRRFDILYSRINTMQQSSVMAGLRENTEAQAALSEVFAELDAMIPTIDGPDETLIAALPEIATQIEAQRSLVRGVSLLGVEHFSRVADNQRTRVANALLRLGILTFLLVAALSAVVLALVKSYRTATRDARERAEAEARMAVIVSTSLDAVVVVNLEGKVIEFNKAAERTFGYDRAEILNQKMSDYIIPEKFHAAHETGMNRYIRTREKRVVGQGRVQLEAKHKSGRTFPVELSISNAEGPDGEVFISFLRDISTRIAKQEELVKARDEAVAGERAKANLVAVMSHEMRTPLNGIVGALELLKTTELNQTQSNMADVMDTSANMLLQHVNDVLDMSRLEAGAVETIRRPFDPVSVTEELLASRRMSAKDGGNSLELSVLDPDFNLVLGDPGKLRQILTNLVGNAIKFTKHGTITVEIEPHYEDGQWELRVSDEGIGISEENQRKVFDDFVTLDPSYTRAQEGTGLGLAIVRRLVEHLKGEIGVESKLGEGSVFWVRLPTNTSPQERPRERDNSSLATPAQKRAPSGPLSILLVEDNAINRVVANEMLAKLGHSCLEAHNGAEAVEMANLRRFDCILMDISMPDMDGVEATRRIRSSGGPNATTPIFAVTAHAMPADVDRFLSAGMEDVLVKPLGLDRLETLLQKNKVRHSEDRDGPPYLDSVVCDDLRSMIGDNKFHELMQQFIAEMDSAAQNLLSAQANSDPVILKQEVHKLAGSASILGASRLRQLLNSIETCLDNQEMENSKELSAQVSACWQETQAAIEAVLAD